MNLSPAQQHRLTHWHVDENKTLITRVWTSQKPQRSLAIKAFCLECCAEDKEAVRHCADICCPLHRLRPYQTCRKGQKAKKPETAKNALKCPRTS